MMSVEHAHYLSEFLSAASTVIIVVVVVAFLTFPR
jgi:hypothetical protein